MSEPGDHEPEIDEPTPDEDLGEPVGIRVEADAVLARLLVEPDGVVPDRTEATRVDHGERDPDGEPAREPADREPPFGAESNE